MEINKNKIKITAILPIFNEEKTVANVLSILIHSKSLDKIIVVDDASTDNSLEIIKKFQSKKLKIIYLSENLGKSGAVKIAVKNLQTDILFFCDGDLRNFADQHINQLLEPLKNGKYLMTVGIRDRGFIHNKFVKKFGPLITGERAMPYEIFNKIKDHPLMHNYGMELILNNYCIKNNILIHKMISKGVHQTLQPYKNKNGIFILFRQTIEFLTTFLKLKLYG